MAKKTLLGILGLALAASASLHATTRATDYPGSVTLLMEVPAVRSDLNLNPAQTAQIKALRNELKSHSKAILKEPKAAGSSLSPDERLFALIDSNNAKALALLNPAQFARFGEIQNQLLTYSMLVSPQLQKRLHLTLAQSASIEALRIRGLEFVAEINHAASSGSISNKNRIDILRDYRLRQAAQIKAILTPSQLKAFAALSGKPLRKG
ncbi:MAG: hypothetical protein WCG66_06980 [bacterium]